MSNRTKSHDEFLLQPDGTRIFTRSWQPAGPARGIVAICHGVKSHSGYFNWLGKRLAETGLAVYALDLRGRGRSSGERFFVDDAARYVDDVGALVDLARSREGNLPVFLLGHSAGGVVSSLYALEHQDGLAGFICESFAFQVYAPAFVQAAVKALRNWTPRLPVLRLKNGDFSRDLAAVATMDADELIAGEVQPVATVAALLKATDRLKAEFSAFSLPLLILHGTADKVTRPNGSRQFQREAGSPDKILKLYEGHSHDLFNDVGRDVVLEDVVGWIDARMPTVRRHLAAV